MPQWATISARNRLKENRLQKHFCTQDKTICDIIRVWNQYLTVTRSPAFSFLHPFTFERTDSLFLTLSVSAAVLQSPDSLQMFCPNGRQLFVHVEAELQVLLGQTEEQQVIPQHLEMRKRPWEGCEKSCRSGGVNQMLQTRHACAPVALLLPPRGTETLAAVTCTRLFFILTVTTHVR